MAFTSTKGESKAIIAWGAVAFVVGIVTGLCVPPLAPFSMILIILGAGALVKGGWEWEEHSLNEYYMKKNTQHPKTQDIPHSNVLPALRAANSTTAHQSSNVRSTTYRQRSWDRFSNGFRNGFGQLLGMFGIGRNTAGGSATTADKPVSSVETPTKKNSPLTPTVGNK